jgi:hypothetical protein
MSVTFNCPPNGPQAPNDSECGTSKEYIWASNTEGFIYYYVPGMNKTLISLDFVATSNNGSNIVVDLIYYVAGVETTVESWNLGTLSTPITKYHYLNFASQSFEVDKFLKLKVKTTNGTSGRIVTSLDCTIEVATALFCTGNTVNPDTNECSCNTSNNVRIYTEKQDSLNYSFPYFKTAWYLDPKLTIPAPCGDYMTVGLTSQIVYTYDCGVNHDTFINYTCGNCTQVTCNSGFYSATHTGYTKNNPYIEGTEPISLNGLVYSIKCFNLKLTASKNNVYVPLTFTYNGTADDVCFTISDPDAVDDNVGVLSYSDFSPLNSPFFIAATNQTLIRFDTGQRTKTIWVIAPLSKVIKVRMAVGQQLVNVKRTVTTRTNFQCGTVFYSYLTTGLHAYSAYDSAYSPKLKTYLYSFVPLSNWTRGTVLFCDRLCSQPAYPYYYNINNTIYKVGTPFLRELGVKRDIIVEKKFLGKTKITERIRQGNWMITLENGEKRSEACIIPYMSMGIITNVMAKSTRRRPQTYLYFMGYSPLEQNGGSLISSNNDFFTFWNGEKQIPCTGFQHAATKLDDAWRQGFALYLAKFGIDVQFAYKNISSTIRSFEAGIAANVGLGVLAASMLYFGFATTAASLQLTCWGFTPLIVQFMAFLGVSTAGLGLIIGAIIIALLAIFVKFRKTIKEPCKLFYIRYNQGPYMNNGNIIWTTTTKTESQSGYYCDGGYFYTYNSSTKSVQKKELSYSLVDGIKNLSIKPDEPTLVVNIPQLMFLPYVSGRPETY